MPIKRGQYRNTVEWGPRVFKNSKIAYVVLNFLLELFAVGYVISSFVRLFQGILRGPLIGFAFGSFLCFLFFAPVPVLGLAALKNPMRKYFYRYIIAMGISFIIFSINLLGYAISSGGLNFFPLIGDSFVDFKVNFEVQVFNDCCVSFLNLQNVPLIDSCEVNNTIPCVDVSLDIDDMVTDKLCRNLNSNQNSFVGNQSSSCGGEEFDFEKFQIDFRSFYEPKITIHIALFSIFWIFLVVNWVISWFLCYYHVPVKSIGQVFQVTMGGSVHVVSIPARIETTTGGELAENQTGTPGRTTPVPPPAPPRVLNRPKPPTVDGTARTENTMFQHPNQSQNSLPRSTPHRSGDVSQPLNGITFGNGSASMARSSNPSTHYTVNSQTSRFGRPPGF